MSKIIGWKMCKIPGTCGGEYTGLSAHALVKLEIDEVDIISSPEIRESAGFVVKDKFMNEPIDMMKRYHELVLDVCMAIYGDSYEKEFRGKLVFNSNNKGWADECVHFVKCRCKKAKVMDIILISKDNEGKICNSVESFWDHTFEYELGEEVEYRNTSWIDNRDIDSSSICGPGIHYFQDWKSALLYSCILSNVLCNELKYAFDKVGDIYAKRENMGDGREDNA